MGDSCVQGLVAYVTGPKRGSRRKMGGRRVRQGVGCSHLHELRWHYYMWLVWLDAPCSPNPTSQGYPQA